MIQAVNGATTANYTYNGNGQRVKKVVDGATTVFHYSQSGQIIAESDSTGTITAEYVYLNSLPLAKIEGANTYYYHNDHLATPQKMTDSNGTVVWSADYKPFGEATITVSTITNNLRFPGQYYDAETRINYNYFRDYNPMVGRYMQSDPIGLRGGSNLYSYVNQNPINLQDAKGLYWWGWWIDPLQPGPNLDDWIPGDQTIQTTYNPITNLGSYFLPGPCNSSREGMTAKVLKNFSYPSLMPNDTATSYGAQTYSVNNDRYERLRIVTKKYYAQIRYALYKCNCSVWRLIGNLEQQRLFKTETLTSTDWWLGAGAPLPDPFMI